MPVAKYRRPLQITAFGLAALLALGLSGVLTPRPAPRYAVTDLGVLPGYGESSASAINNDGLVACRATPTGSHGSWGQTRGRAFLSQGGRLTDLGALPGTNGDDPQGINAKGEVTGSADFPGGRHAFLYSAGRLRDLGVPPGCTDSAGVGINDRGKSPWTRPTVPPGRGSRAHAPSSTVGGAWQVCRCLLDARTATQAPSAPPGGSPATTA